MSKKKPAPRATRFPKTIYLCSAKDSGENTGSDPDNDWFMVEESRECAAECPARTHGVYELKRVVELSVNKEVSETAVNTPAR